MHRLLLCISLIVVPCLMRADDVTPELSKAVQLLKTGVYEKNKPYVEEACGFLAQHATTIANDTHLLKEIENSTKAAQAREWKDYMSYLSAPYSGFIKQAAWVIIGFSTGMVLSSITVALSDQQEVLDTTSILMGSTAISTFFGIFISSPKEGEVTTPRNEQKKEDIIALCQRLQAKILLQKK